MSTSPSSVSVVTPQYNVEITTTQGLVSFRNNVTLIETYTTSKDMAGAWRVQLVFREDSDGNDDYQLIEPMDYVRIKMGYDPTSTDDSQITTVMRGFVTNIQESFSIDDGRPVRVINISGENYSRLIKMGAIHYIIGLDPPRIITASGTAVPLLIGHGVDLVFNAAPPSKVVTSIFNQLISPNFNNLKNLITNRGSTSTPAQQQTASQVAQSVDGFTLDVDVAGVDGSRKPTGIPNPQIFPMTLQDPSAGTSDTMVYDFINEFCCRPWNEIFVDDAPTQSYLVYRPFPYRDRNGGYVGYTGFGQLNTSNYPGPAERASTMNPVKVEMEEVVAHQLRRSDESIYNYFFTDAVFSSPSINYEMMSYIQETNLNPHFTVDFSKAETPAGITTLPSSTKIDFSRMELFGYREYKATTKYISVDPRMFSDPNAFNTLYGPHPTTNIIELGQQLNQILFNGMEHNGQLEDGEITIKGRNDIRPGMFIQFTYSRKSSTFYMYYVTDVMQQFFPYQVWLTKLTVIRGEGHLKPQGVTTQVSHTITY